MNIIIYCKNITTIPKGFYNKKTKLYLKINKISNKLFHKKIKFRFKLTKL